eukprot:TRINITY_DN6674_c1_g1_i1.p3 TRINITY_DN6674_c1_g1~~TRINITY_DN6674_c1_g1_i1.p3  ORF type:complete len:105 (-),score=12.32 TRINITY_DN6674_c1_g1_i1:106-420(-)
MFEHRTGASAGALLIKPWHLPLTEWARELRSSMQTQRRRKARGAGHPPSTLSAHADLLWGTLCRGRRGSGSRCACLEVVGKLLLVADVCRQQEAEARRRGGRQG